MWNDPEGEWVEYEDVKELEELNREMREALGTVCLSVCEVKMDCSKCKLGFVEKVLQKARVNSAKTLHVR